MFNFDYNIALYNNLLENTYKDIVGITVIDSGVSGPSCGLFAITHGNEPVGLQIFDYLLNEFNLKEKLLRGKIYLIANNIKAYKEYEKTQDISRHRFLDHNMNRISNQEYCQDSYEFKRLGEIRKIMPELDFAIDIHSVSSGNDFFGISDFSYLQVAKNFMNVSTILVDNIGETGALIADLIREGKEAYGIECGNHINDDGKLRGSANIENFLKYKGLIEGKNIQQQDDILILEFLEPIHPKTDNFRFKEIYTGFTPLKIGEIFADDGDYIFSNTVGQDIYLGIAAKYPKKGDDVGFLFRKIE